MRRNLVGSELKKTLGGLGVFALGAGAMISSGLFVLPAIAFRESGTGVLIAYALAGVCMIPAVFTKLELASAMTKSGGAFFYLTRIFGAPVGLISGLADWFSIALKSAFALIGIGVFGSLVFPSFGEPQFKLIAVAACVFFTAVNLISVGGAGRFQVIMVGALLVILAGYVLVGYRRMEFGHFTSGDALSASRIVSTTAMVFISYGGITKVATAVEEVKDPRRVLLPGILSAFFVAQILYLLVIFVTLGAMDAGELANSQSPLTDAARSFFSSPGAATAAMVTLAAGGMLSFFTTANAGILSASRVPLAMSRDGLLPAVVGKVSTRGTPVSSILATSVFMIAIIIWLDVADLAKVASLFLLLVFFLENLGVIVMRKSAVANYHPLFKAPLFPYLQLFGVAVYAVLIASQGAKPLLIAGGFIALSLLWYVVYGRRGYSRSSAFVTIVKRLTEPDFGAEDLENELLGILMDRDGIKEDRFDSIILRAPVLDYEATVDRDQVFSDVSEVLAGRWSLNAGKLREKFLERELLTTTVICSGVAVPHAIPHAIVEGTSIFDLALVRSRSGIRWTDDDVVYTAFAMIGSKDERNFHLRALMAIAQILQDPEFSGKWGMATNDTELRTAVILANRNRHE